MIIGFSTDIGYLLGDTKEHYRTFKGTRGRAAFVFIIGFCMLDLANNTMHGPTRVLLVNLSGPKQRNLANALFCSWMAVGNILGFSSGASENWHSWFPFLTSRACCEACGGLKVACLVAVEVPLTINQPHLSSNFAPLLNDPQQMGFDVSKPRSDTPIVDHATKSKIESGYEMDKNIKKPNQIVEEDESGSYNDGPRAVLVNLLTSVRHLPRRNAFCAYC